MANIALGFETRTIAALATELVSRAQEAAELTAVRVQARLQASAAKYTDTGEMERSISVEVTGGLGGFGPREVGVIAVATSEHAEWVDKGTGPAIFGTPFMTVGARSPNRRNAPTQHKGNVYLMSEVNGQQATGWFSSPGGIPLGEIMRNTLHGIYRRLR